MALSQDIEYAVSDTQPSLPIAVDDLACLVCRELPVTPHRVPHENSNHDDCGVILCEDCYHGWRGQHSGQCPNCRAPTAATVGPGSTRDAALLRILGSLPARCRHCGLAATRSDLSAHVRTCVDRLFHVLADGHGWATATAVRGGTSLVCHGFLPCMSGQAASRCRFVSIVTDLVGRAPERTRAFLYGWLRNLVLRDDADYTNIDAFRPLSTAGHGT